MSSDSILSIVIRHIFPFIPSVYRANKIPSKHGEPVKNKTGVPSKAKDRVAMSTELSHLQFYELVMQIIPLVFSTSSGSLDVAVIYVDSLFRDMVISKSNSKREESLGKVFTANLHDSFSGFHIRYTDGEENRYHMVKSNRSPEEDIIRALWLKNMHQMRLIYDFYANSMEPCRDGRGHVKKVACFEDVRQFLKDWGVMPRHCDLPTLQQMYRGCKIWEWGQAYGVMDVPFSDLNEEENEVKTINKTHTHYLGW